MGQLLVIYPTSCVEIRPYNGEDFEVATIYSVQEEVVALGQSQVPLKRLRGILVELILDRI